MSGTYQAVKLGPDNRPSNGTVLAQADTADELMHLWQPGKVVIAWSYDAPEPRRLSREALASVRRKRLQRRLERKFPLLASDLYAAEIAARPAFYDGHRSAQEHTE